MRASCLTARDRKSHLPLAALTWSVPLWPTVTGLRRIAQVSVQVKKQAQEETEHFEGPILEYGRMTTALKTALNKRNEKKITYLTAANDLEAKRAHHSKLEGMGGDRQVRFLESWNETATR